MKFDQDENWERIDKEKMNKSEKQNDRQWSIEHLIPSENCNKSPRHFDNRQNQECNNNAAAERNGNALLFYF